MKRCNFGNILERHFFSGVMGTQCNTSIQISGVLCHRYLSIIMPYLYPLLPENTIKSGCSIAGTRLIVGSLYSFK
jgi:hypothetical protein